MCVLWMTAVQSRSLQCFHPQGSVSNKYFVRRFFVSLFYLFNRDTVESGMKNVRAFLRSQQNRAGGQRAASSQISFYVILHNRSAFQNKAAFSFIIVQLNVLPEIIYSDKHEEERTSCYQFVCLFNLDARVPRSTDCFQQQDIRVIDLSPSLDVRIHRLAYLP